MTSLVTRVLALVCVFGLASAAFAEGEVRSQCQALASTTLAKDAKGDSARTTARDKVNACLAQVQEDCEVEIGGVFTYSKIAESYGALPGKNIPGVKQTGWFAVQSSNWKCSL